MSGNKTILILEDNDERIAAFQKAEMAKWAKTIKDANIKVD